MTIDKIKNYLLDLDGTLYLGSRLFEGTLPLLEKLRATGRRAVFLTNNSSISDGDYVRKLNKLGIPAAEGDVFSSTDAAMYLLRETCVELPKTFLLGTPSLRAQLESEGLPIVNDSGEKAELVLLGFDKTLTYESLCRACALISSGTRYVATHPDLVCPTEDGFIPDAGSMIKLIEAATGRLPEVAGKPEKTMADALCAKYGFKPSRTAMVGDRLSTDIAFAANAGFASMLVLSGETDITMYTEQHDVNADFLFEDVGALAESIPDDDE